MMKTSENAQEQNLEILTKRKILNPHPKVNYRQKTFFFNSNKILESFDVHRFFTKNTFFEFFDYLWGLISQKIPRLNSSLRRHFPPPYDPPKCEKNEGKCTAHSTGYHFVSKCQAKKSACLLCTFGIARH